MLTDDYRVKLEYFEGPLDLLLYLIRRAEVAITDIPVAVIADQYMEHLKGIERIDIEVAGEFLVMAATLMELKSRELMPRQERGPAEGDEPGVGDEADPRAELVRQLLAYKRYRDAAERLDERRREWEARFPGGRAGIDDERLRGVLAEQEGLDLDDVDLVDLVEAFARIIESVDFTRVGAHTVEFDDTPLELHAEDLLDQLRRAEHEHGPNRVGGRRAGIPLERMLTGRNRSDMIGLFLALLELIRLQKVSVRHGDHTGAGIIVALREETDGDPVHPGT